MMVWKVCRQKSVKFNNEKMMCRYFVYIIK